MPEAPPLRDATPNDAAVIAEIYNQWLTPDEPQLTTEAVQQQMARFTKRETYVLLQREATVLGWGLLKRYSDRGGYRFCGETAVYLRRAEIRKGYGTTLKKALIARCKMYGYHHLLARVLDDNTAALTYNMSLGYNIVGRQQEICRKNGRWHDMVILQCILPDVPPVIPAAYQE